MLVAAAKWLPAAGASVGRVLAACDGEGELEGELDGGGMGDGDGEAVGGDPHGDHGNGCKQEYTQLHHGDIILFEIN